jgi:hypothetical protein
MREIASGMANNTPARQVPEREGLPWTILAAAFGAIAILKGIRRPNLWAATQAQIGYEHGFVKRGLFGALARSLSLGLENYSRFALVSEILLAIVVIGFAWYIWKSRELRALDRGLLIAAFAASFAVTVLAHLVGYLDIPLLGLALLVLCLRGAAQAGAALVCAVASILIHELYFLVFLPVTILPLFLGALKRPSEKRGFAVIAFILIVAVAAVEISAHSRSLNALQAGELQQEIAERVDFPVDTEFFDVLARSASDNLAIMRSLRAEPDYWPRQIYIGIATLPPAILFLYVTLRSLGRFSGWRRCAALMATAIASLSPLLMHALGWDIVRWDCLTVVTAFLAMSVCLHDSTPLELHTRLRVAAVCVIGIGLAAGPGLMDGQNITPFPFVQDVTTLHQVLRSGHIPAPSR